MTSVQPLTRPMRDALALMKAQDGVAGYYQINRLVGAALVRRDLATWTPVHKQMGYYALTATGLAADAETP